MDDLSLTDVHSLLVNYERALVCNAHLNNVVVYPLANVASKQIGKDGNSHQFKYFGRNCKRHLVMVLVDITVDITTMLKAKIDPGRVQIQIKSNVSFMVFLDILILLTVDILTWGGGGGGLGSAQPSTFVVPILMSVNSNWCANSGSIGYITADLNSLLILFDFKWLKIIAVGNGCFFIAFFVF